jgi:hypothetical protein
MPLASPRFFNPDPAEVRSLRGLDLIGMFNDHVLPGVNALGGDIDLDGEDEASRQRRDQAATEDQELSDFRRSEDDAFLAARGRPAPPAPRDPQIFDYTSDDDSQFDRAGGSGNIKLANYGHDSDTSPDRNSNVLRIGHSNNKLEDGVSAAVTRSLAKRLKLKKGAWFTAHTSDGKKYRRRYDDTVPPTYKGKKLRETVDLYRPKDGSNKFGGSVTRITLD